MKHLFLFGSIPAILLMSGCAISQPQQTIKPQNIKYSKKDKVYVLKSDSNVKHAVVLLIQKVKKIEKDVKEMKTAKAIATTKPVTIQKIDIKNTSNKKSKYDKIILDFVKKQK